MLKWLRRLFRVNTPIERLIPGGIPRGVTFKNCTMEGHFIKWACGCGHATEAEHRAAPRTTPSTT
jgi:hypothetical protein